MLDVGQNYGNTEKNNICWRLRETEDFVCVGGWPMTFTTSTAGVGWPVTGENTTIVSDAFVEDVTHMGTESGSLRKVS
jgi:hypothetical protein